MKKFVAVFGGLRMDEGTLKYAIQVSKSANARLVGVFSDVFIDHSYHLYEARTAQENFEKVVEELNKENVKKRTETINKFQRACEKAGIPFSFHKDQSMSLQELKRESIYADLIIVNEDETLTKEKEPAPTHFIKDLLGDAQCPVLVVPSTFKPIEKIILLYDGAPAAVHAIKMFTYVLGNSENLPVKVFTVKEQKKSAFFVPENKLMREFIKGHFPKATFAVARGNAELEIGNYLKSHPKDQLVVLGAYQRSAVSRWFKTSMADKLMSELDLPLFIAHNR